MCIVCASLCRDLSHLNTCRRVKLNVIRHKIADNVSCRLRRMNSERYCVQRTAWKTMYDGASSPTRVPPRSPVQYSLLDIPTASVRGRQVLDLLTAFVNIPRSISLRWQYSVTAYSDLKPNINTERFPALAGIVRGCFKR